MRSTPYDSSSDTENNVLKFKKGNNLKELAGDEDLQAVGISPQDRAEHIAPEKYVELSNYLVRKVV